MRQLPVVLDVGGPVGLYLPPDLMTTSAVCVLPDAANLARSLELLVERHERRAVSDPVIREWLLRGGITLLERWIDEFSSQAWAVVADNSTAPERVLAMLISARPESR
jgi:hypothetical protein